MAIRKTEQWEWKEKEKKVLCGQVTRKLRRCPRSHRKKAQPLGGGWELQAPYPTLYVFPPLPISLILYPTSLQQRIARLRNIERERVKARSRRKRVPTTAPSRSAFQQ